ncbi:MAG: N-acetylglucosamine-6-phosphate deacetylase [Dehalococcoidia bacterium]
MTSRLLLRNGVLALPGGPVSADVLCDGERIVGIGREIQDDSAEVFDATGLTLGPGLIDIHVHGGGGHSFFTEDPERIRAYAAWAPRNGVTSFLISTIGRDSEHTAAILRALAPTIGAGAGAEPLGFHLEGPFINPDRRGAFEPGMLRAPSQEEFALYQEAAGGLIRQVTLAPELPGAADVIAGALATGCAPAMSHTDATADQARRAFGAGVRHVTHLFNAMRPIHQREGGPSIAALLEDSVSCELICDGAHVAPEVLRAAYRILGPSRTTVITDNLHLAGTAEMAGRFGGQPIAVTGATAVRQDGTIVGSISTLDQHFRNVVEFFGVDLATAFRLCSTNPARVVGSARRKGALEPGMDADIVLLDSDYQVAATVCRGQLAYRR